MHLLHNFFSYFAFFSHFVRLTGLEPARRETLDPKSSASTNSATGANADAKVRISEQIAKLFD